MRLIDDGVRDALRNEREEERETMRLIDDLRVLANYMEEMKIGKSPELIREAADQLEEQNERIAIMQESMEAMERRLAAAEGKLVEVKSIDQIVYVGWMHEDQKLGLCDSDL